MSITPVICGFGHYAPEKIVSNQDLEKLVDTSDEWITTRTGIKQRHIVVPGEQSSSDLALEASKMALADAGLSPKDLTHILFATLTPDTYCPSAACYLEQKLGVRGLMAMDLNAACSGFLYSLQTARAMVALDPDAVVLVAASEVLSSRVNWTDRSTCVLFGDGSGAAVVTADTGAGKAQVLDLILGSDGNLTDLLLIPAGGSRFPLELGGTVDKESYIQLNGPDVFKHAVREMEAITNTLLEKNGLAVEDIDLFVPHQANVRIIDALAKRVGVPPEKVFVNIDRYGNTSAASVPIALSDALQQNAIQPGMRILITTFGAGFTWGSCILQF
ncbi:MAG: ketoacyl-ACP synthase III [Desulfovibrio sp.]|nr:MAG: ketoacyl-ACP synthase III [Desulfovibrio sp.]